MDRTRSMRWAGRYFLYTLGASLLGLLLVGVGGYLLVTGLTFGTGSINGIPIPAARTQAYLAVVPIVLGVATYRFGKAWALYQTMTGAMEEELGDTFDTEHVKSDIVAVLDDRLADMQQDLQSVNRELRNMKQADAFEFSDE